MGIPTFGSRAEIPAGKIEIDSSRIPACFGEIQLDVLQLSIFRNPTDLSKEVKLLILKI